MPRKKSSKVISIDKTKEKYEAEIMAIPGVTGIGIGNDERNAGLAIKVYVESVTPDLRRRIPAKLDGYPLVLEATGEFKAFSP
jgi:hypothetical protein